MVSRGTDAATGIGMPTTYSRVRNSAGAFLVALSLAIPVAAAPDGRAAGTPAVRIDNFGRVDASLYRGAQPEGRDYADLKSLGVKTIVNLTSDDAQQDEKSMTESAGMSYFRNETLQEICQTDLGFGGPGSAATRPVGTRFGRSPAW